MARQVLPIAGAVIGGFFGMPQVGFAIGSLIGNAVDPMQIQGPKIGDMAVQTSRDGVPRPIVFGTAAVFGNIIDRSEPRIVKKKERQGKGGPETVTEHVYMSFAIRICEGPITSISRIWENEKLVYDVTAGSTIVPDSARFIEKVTFYLGGETQLPDPTLEALHGVGNTPAHRGTAYAVWNSKDLTEFGGAIPQYRFEVNGSVSGTSSNFQSILHLDTDFTDTDGRDYDILPTPTISSSQSKFGTSSMYRVGGANDSYATIFTDVPIDSSIAWSVECWFYGTSFSGSGGGENNCIFQLYNGDPVLGTGQIAARVNGYTGYLSEDGLTGSVNVSSASWHHIAMCSEGGTIWVYGDGVLSDTNGAQTFPGGLGFCLGGARNNGGDLQTGYYDESRVNIGTCFYPNGTTFTPPTATFASTYPPISLSNIVTRLSSRIGVDSTKIDVSELTDDVTGFVVAGGYSCAEALRSLQKTYFFDPVEVDGIIYFKKRGAANALTIDESEMVGEPEETTREQEIEFPKKLHLSYQNADIAYAATQANAQRNSPDVRVTSEASIEVPVVLDADQAAQIVDKMIKIAWIDAMGEVRFKLPDNYSYLVPTDCVLLTYRGRSVRVRIEKVELSDGVLDITSRFDRVSAYATTVTGVAPIAQLPPVSTAVGDTYFEVLNIPALIDQDDRLGYYTIAAGELGGWAGGSMQRSIDAGANYIEIDTFGAGAIMGELTQTLGIASEFVTDTTNTLTVQLYSPDPILESVSAVQFLQDYNAALVGDEIIQFMDATDLGAGIFELTTLTRGRLATTPASHSIGTRFCLLEGCHFAEVSSALIGQSLTHRAVAYTTDSTLAPTDTQTYSPALSQTEFAPIGLTLSKAGNILTASWTPRHRFGTAISPVASINFEGFDIQIVGSSTIALTTTLSTITQDITGLGTVTVTVAGINRITGVSTLTASGVI